MAHYCFRYCEFLENTASLQHRNMKRLLTLFFLAALLGSAKSQDTKDNFVPNPSFEATQCPIFSPDPKDYISPWTTYFGTPDYYEPNCGNAGSLTTTNNSQAFDGDGFLGISVYGQNGGNYLRDYIHAELKDSLVKGQLYRITFYVKPVFVDNGSYGVNNIGMLLTDTIVDTIPTDSLITATPQVFGTEPVINMNFWTPICGVYKAKGGERFITIGNFFTDSETGATPLENSVNPQRGYFLIDYVQIVENDFPQLPSDSVICLQGRIDLDITRPDYSYTWQDGTTGGKYTITSAGDYTVRVSSPYCSYTDSLNIKAVECSDCKVFVPNAFTPNGDGRNDLFQLRANCELLDFRLQIFDRWGQKIFETIDIDVSWDGLDVDKTATFTYNLQYTFSKFRKSETESRRGYLTLIK